MEQVCIAAFDLRDDDLIKECLNELETKFPNSLRVLRLKTMGKLEVRERYDDAIPQYNKLIKNDESNALSYKRRVAILIAELRTGDAIKELTEYLKLFMNDQEAWMELCDLYIDEQEYQKAAFCMEEVILANPYNHFYYERYATIQYTINTPDSLELARSYYAQAVRLNSSNVRALYGLILANNSLANLPKCASQKRKEYSRLASWASVQLSKLYQESSNDDDKINSLETMISNLQINSAT